MTTYCVPSDFFVTFLVKVILGYTIYLGFYLRVCSTRLPFPCSLSRSLPRVSPADVCPGGLVIRPSPFRGETRN